jgi:hypothetical protein
MAESPRRLRDISGSNALSEFRSEDEPAAPATEGKPRAKTAATASKVRAPVVASRQTNEPRDMVGLGCGCPAGCGWPRVFLFRRVSAATQNRSTP